MNSARSVYGLDLASGDGLPGAQSGCRKERSSPIPIQPPRGAGSSLTDLDKWGRERGAFLNQGFGGGKGTFLIQGFGGKQPGPNLDAWGSGGRC